MEQIADGWEKVGFVVKDRRVGREVDRIIGYAPRESPARLGLPADKASLLHEGFRRVLS